MRYQHGRNQARNQARNQVPNQGQNAWPRSARHLATSLAASLASTFMLGAIATAEPIPFGQPLPGRASADESAAPTADSSAPPRANRGSARSQRVRGDRPSAADSSLANPSTSVNSGARSSTETPVTPGGGWLDSPGTPAAAGDVRSDSVSSLAPSASGYVVVVPGETLALLDQVRQWDPDASFSTEGGRTVVQSAPVATLAAAQARQAQWRSRGLAATVAPAPRSPSLNSVNAAGWAIRPAIASPGAGVAVASANTSTGLTSSMASMGMTSSMTSTGMVDPSFLFATPETAPPRRAIAGMPATANLEPIPANAGAPPIGNADASRASLPAPPPIPPEFLAQAPAAIAPALPTRRPATQPVLPVATTADPYYILIEGSDRELAQVGDRLLSFGLPRSSLSRQREPFGPHLRLGPFNSVNSAQQWSNYLQRINVAAQVYHNGWIVDATQAMR